MKDEILNCVDLIAGEIVDLSRAIHSYKEIGFEEIKSAKALVNYLREQGFTVQQGIADFKTAFVGSMGKGKPHVALLCEYDALPEVGHGCGHNQIAMISVGAAVAIVKSGVLQKYPGTITLVGCPAEERGNIKGKIVKAGVFRDVDAAMIIHPAFMSTGYDITYAIQQYTIEFFGKSAHAAMNPDKGINALDAMVLFFQGVGLMRQQMPEKNRVHGIIKNGGQSSNTIPDYTSAEICIRSLGLKELKNLALKVESLVAGAAKMTGCTYKNTLTDDVSNVFVNVPLAEKLTQIYESLGEKTTPRTYKQGLGSTDVGEVSYVVPTIHGIINITNSKKIALHTPELAEIANSLEGYHAMIQAVRALALTTYEIFSVPAFLKEVKEYFIDNMPK